MIKFSAVHKLFGSTAVLQDINLEIKVGEVVVVCGPSGSGKSTLCRTINGLEPIQGGEITVDGRSIAAYQGTALQPRVGMVFQDFALFANKTVLENIVIPQIVVARASIPDAQRTADQLLESVSMGAHASKFPRQLSGGQQQRVAIARALAMKPAYLLFDEPTSALDPEMVADVLNVMESLARAGMTMVVVTHEMGFARRVGSRVIFMNEGRVEEDVPSERFFSDPQSARAREFLARIVR